MNSRHLFFALCVVIPACLSGFVTWVFLPNNRQTPALAVVECPTMNFTAPAPLSQEALQDSTDDVKEFLKGVGACHVLEVTTDLKKNRGKLVTVTREDLLSCLLVVSRTSRTTIRCAGSDGIDTRKRLAFCRTLCIETAGDWVNDTCVAPPGAHVTDNCFVEQTEKTTL